MTYTQTITITNTETRMILRPSVLNIRNEFRNVINNRITDNNSRLPSTPSIESISVIDRDSIIELNNSTSSERRLEFMQNVINYQNSDNNRFLLIENSSSQVRFYLHNLLIRSANNSNISEQDLYRIGNIFLYTISNLNDDGLLIRDIINNIRETLVIYNTNQIFSILDSQISNYNNYLNEVELATEEQLQERVQRFHREIDDRIALNRRRMVYAGIGLLSSITLTSVGIPPLVLNSLLLRLPSFISNERLIVPAPQVEEVVRFRDVFDAFLKKMLFIIQD